MPPTLDRDHHEILYLVRQYYLYTLSKHGATHLGVDWESSAQQFKRFEHLMDACAPERTFSINDYGCGYGALAGYLQTKYESFSYCGFDIVEMMIDRARLLHTNLPSVTFTSDPRTLRQADYTVASGVFNVKFDVPLKTWQTYVLDTIERMALLSDHAFAFNILMHDDAADEKDFLYYGDPQFFVSHCKKRYSLGASASQDSELGEFTVYVPLGRRVTAS